MKRCNCHSIMVLGATLFLLLGTATLPGCDTQRSNRIDRADYEPDLTLQSTARRIYAGEIVTVTTKTSNLLGHDSDIQWNTTGGEITPTDDGRMARVQFDRPGTYIVSAQLMIDGEPFKTDSISVEVLPLR